MKQLSLAESCLAMLVHPGLTQTLARVLSNPCKGSAKPLQGFHWSGHPQRNDQNEVLLLALEAEGSKIARG